MSNNENIHQSITTDMIDEPLIIVLDEDDDYDDDLGEDFGPLITTIVTDTEDEDVHVENLLKPPINTKSKIFNRSNDSSNSSTNLNKSTRPILIDTSFIQPSNLQQHRGKQKIPSVSIDSPLSFLTFDKIPNVLTVSRMGSIYFCVEDLYLKIFSSFCTLEEFAGLLSKPLKQVTLSEKLSIVQQNPSLKQFNNLRYRLISINQSEYLLKLKQIFIANRHKKRMRKMRSLKRVTTSNSSASKKRSSPDYSQCNKRLKNDTNKEKPNNNLAKYSSENLNPKRRIGLYRSKSLIFNSTKISNRLSRSDSLPSIKFKLKDRIQLKYESIDPFDDSYLMPMIVNVEENVQTDNSIDRKSQQSPPFPYLRDSSSSYLTPIGTPYNLYLRDLRATTSDITRDAFPIIMSLLEKPIYHRLITSEKPVQSNCTSCSSQQPSTLKTRSSFERMIHRHCVAKLPLLFQEKQHRMLPYLKTNTYFAPLSSHCPPANKSTHKPSIPINSLQVPKSLHTQTQSIDLSRAIIEHDNCDMDIIPKLVVRHRKFYANKTIDTMGQLFPTWFVEPNYRCIHCFNCDHVFTPQLFMTHLDDKQMADEQLVDMTSIELLTSEKMSAYKVELWNQFCADLTIYASKFTEAVKNKNSWK